MKQSNQGGVHMQPKKYSFNQLLLFDPVLQMANLKKSHATRCRLCLIFTIKTTIKRLGKV